MEDDSQSSSHLYHRANEHFQHAGSHFRISLQELNLGFSLLWKSVWAARSNSQQSASLASQQEETKSDDNIAAPLVEQSLNGSDGAFARSKKSKLDEVDTSVFLRTDPWKEAWDAVIMLAILYSSSAVPVRVCFDAEAEGKLWVLEVVLSLLFLLDLLFSFNTAFMETGAWIRDRGRIAKHYLTGWFWVDAPSSIPTELIELAVGRSSLYGKGVHHEPAYAMLRLLRLMRLVRLLRLLKVEMYTARLEDTLEVNLRTTRLLLLIAKLFYAAHLMGCLWYAVASNTEEGQPTWLSTYDDGAALEKSTYNQYTLSLYWALTTLSTVGYGDITPVSDREREFAIAGLLAGAIFFAYVVGDIGKLLRTMDRQASLIEDEMDALREWIVWRNLPKELGVRMRRYFEHFYAHKSVFDEGAILSTLSPQLHDEVVDSLLKATVGSIFSREAHSPAFQKSLFPLLMPLKFGQGEIIFLRGAASDDLMLLTNGLIHVVDEHDHPYAVITPQVETLMSAEDGSEQATFPNGGLVGEHVLIGSRRRATHVAATACDMLSIRKADLEGLFAAHPASARRFCKVVLKSVMRKEWLRALATRLRMRSMPIKSPDRAALTLQIAWRRYCNRIALEHEPICRLIFEREDASRRSVTSSADRRSGGGAPSSAAASAFMSIHGMQSFKRAKTSMLSRGADRTMAPSPSIIATAPAGAPRLATPRSQRAEPTPRSLRPTPEYVVAADPHDEAWRAEMQALLSQLSELVARPPGEQRMRTSHAMARRSGPAVRMEPPPAAVAGGGGAAPRTSISRSNTSFLLRMNA